MNIDFQPINPAPSAGIDFQPLAPAPAPAASISDQIPAIFHSALRATAAPFEALTAPLDRAAGTPGPAARATGYVMDDPTRRAALMAGLRGEPSPTPDAESRVINTTARFALPAAVTLAMPAAEAMDLGGLAAARYLPELGPAGFHGARALAGAAQQGGLAGLTALGQHLTFGAPPAEAAKNAADTGKSFAEGAAAGELLPPSASWAWDKLKGAGRAGLEKAAELYSGIKPESFEMLRQKPDEVLAAARQGVTVIPETGKPVPVALQEAKAAARGAQEAIKANAAGAGEKYQEMIDALHEAPANAENFDLGQRVRGGMEDYVRKNTPYARANMPSTASGDKKVFMEYFNRATDPAGMAPKDAAEFLQDITGDIQRFKGQPIAAHLSELKNQVLEAMPGEYKFPEVIDSPTPGQPAGVDIRGARASYATAKQLERDLKPFWNADDPLGSVNRILAKGGKLADRLRAAADQIPEVQQALERAGVAQAGADFAPKISARLPRTGLVGSALEIASDLTPKKAVAMPLILTGAAPRLTGELLGNYGPRGAELVQAAGRAAAPAIAPTVAASALGGGPPSDRDALSILLAQGGLNPKKSGAAGAGISGLGLPARVASNSGRMSLDDLTRVWAERGVIPEEDPQMTLAKLKALAENSR